ncbi:MAG: crotonase/enoyl-CoA hydratase family protein [Nitriliruptorales bacterium]|nr:crotonase/enoyl-CoA hydratase family protein [Nitriliruptorales bacterium]
MTVRTDHHEDVLVITIDRPEVRNAVDRPTADALEQHFRDFDANPDLAVAVLTGAGGTFCAGADLHAIHSGEGQLRVQENEHGPMGPSRLLLSKPVIAAVEGHAIAGGLELAAWCDLRVAAEDAVFGVFCRRWGVPLIDGGNVRLPRLIGLSHALDMILTGRAVGAEEAQRMGLANRVVPPGTALDAALELARQLAVFPQSCLRADRLTALTTIDLPLHDALMAEHRRGVASMDDGAMEAGVAEFAGGAGRHGTFDG